MPDSLADHAAAVRTKKLFYFNMSSIIVLVQIRYVYEMVYQAMSQDFLHEL